MEGRKERFPGIRVPDINCENETAGQTDGCMVDCGCASGWVRDCFGSGQKRAVPVVEVSPYSVVKFYSTFSKRTQAQQAQVGLRSDYLFGRCKAKKKHDYYLQRDPIQLQCTPPPCCTVCRRISCNFRASPTYIPGIFRPLGWTS